MQHPDAETLYVEKIDVGGSGVCFIDSDKHKTVILFLETRQQYYV